MSYETGPHGREVRVNRRIGFALTDAGRAVLATEEGAVLRPIQHLRGRAGYTITDAGRAALNATPAAEHDDD